MMSHNHLSHLKAFPDNAQPGMGDSFRGCRLQKQGKPGAQTVFRGELYAMLQLARYPLHGRSGGCDIRLSWCPKCVRSQKPGKTHQDIWWKLQTTEPTRVKMKWVPSHVSEEEFLQKVEPPLETAG